MVGLYLDMAGIEWEHVSKRFNSGVWHHWCVVTVDGKRYITDPYTCLFVEETVRNDHPISEYYDHISFEGIIS